MKVLFVLSVICLLSSCSGDDSSSDQESTAIVLINGSNALCGSGAGFGIENSEGELINNGIDVLSSKCGFALDSVGDISCDPFDTVYYHEVFEQNIKDAEQLGYISEQSLLLDYGLSLKEMPRCI